MRGTPAPIARAQVAEIAGSIRAFGFINPILVGEDGDVIAGHGRLAAARLLELTEAPVIVLEGPFRDSAPPAGACRQPDCPQCRVGHGDAEAGAGRPLGARRGLEELGFSKEELAAALSPATAGLTDEDEAPALQETPVSRPGDIWCLGPASDRLRRQHRRRGGRGAPRLRQAELMVTDPPYGRLRSEAASQVRLHRDHLHLRQPGEPSGQKDDRSFSSAIGGGAELTCAAGHQSPHI